MEITPWKTSVSPNASPKATPRKSRSSSLRGVKASTLGQQIKVTLPKPAFDSPLQVKSIRRTNSLPSYNRRMSVGGLVPYNPSVPQQTVEFNYNEE